jgi:hypothetical protein
MEPFMPSAIQPTALRGRSQSASDKFARNLGYLSIALGMAELLAPRAVSNAVGMRGLDSVVRAYGAREVATGLAILTSHNPEPWIWARVAGDIADMATVATGLQQYNAKKQANVLALGALAAVTTLDVACARSLDREKGNRKTAMADYSSRTGFPGGLQAAWGAARDAPISDDMKTPRSLRPFNPRPTTALASNS